MACPRCGSWSVRADRSLAGRMVCGRCATPLQGIKRNGKTTAPLNVGSRSWRWWLLGLVVAAASMAALDPGSQQLFKPQGDNDRKLDWWQ